MVKYVCKNCNYRFESEQAHNCPYCDREDTIEKEKSASEILEEVSTLLEN